VDAGVGRETVNAQVAEKGMCLDGFKRWSIGHLVSESLEDRPIEEYRVT
jgi:hypothetical protein